MVSDSEIVSRLREFLRTSDLNTTTTAIVRRKLEEDFGIDLSDKKAFIREQVDLFLQSQFEKGDGNEDVDEEVEVEEDGGGEEEEEEEDQKEEVKAEEGDGSDSKDEDDDEEEEEEVEESSNGKGSKKRGAKMELLKTQ